VRLLPGRTRSALAALLDQPRRFGFDAAVRLLWRAGRQPEPSDAVQFRSPGSLAFPPAEVLSVQPGKPGGRPQMRVGMMGLTGPSGVLPRWYNEVLAITLRDRSQALHEFLDMLAQRFIAQFARAGAKYRPHRAAEIGGFTRVAKPDPVAQALLALTGLGTPGLTDRLAAGNDPVLHYAGLLATRPRSADRLAALVSDWLGREVEVVQFAGAWLTLPPEAQSRMPTGRMAGAFNRLGVDVAAGTRAWDPQARIILRVGPLDRAAFAALLPDRPGLRRLVSLVRTFLGFEIGFAVNPVLAADEIPPLQLAVTADPPPRLGWNTWAPSPAPPSPGMPRRRDAADAIFEAEIVEAAEAAERGKTA